MLPRHTHRVVVVSLNICGSWVSCHAQTGRECRSYDPGDNDYYPKDQQKTLWKEVRKATGWRAGRCRHVQVSELLSMEKCDKAVMDFLVTTNVGKFPPKRAE